MSLAQPVLIARQLSFCFHRLHAPPSVDILPTELLERVISIGATGYAGPEIKWIFKWQRVSRKWASVIDRCPALWSYIEVSAGAGSHVSTQLIKSKGVPLIIHLSSGDDDYGWIRLLVDNVRRWKSIRFYSSLAMEKASAMLDSPPPMLEALKIYETYILPDSKFFHPSSPNLRVLELSEVTIPSNIPPVIGLEELHLSRIHEALGDGICTPISVRKLHQFLQASPGLQVLELAGDCSVSAADASLQPVDLPNLEELEVHGLPVLHLFRAEHCADLAVSLYSVKEMLPSGAWTTVVSTLRRAKELRLDVLVTSLEISSLVGPPTIRLRLHIELEQANTNLAYSILEEILQELENESSISARIQLSLYANENNVVKVLKLLQSPMPGPSFRWRLPHLDTVSIWHGGVPYQSLQIFAQARANAQGDQAPRAVTRILEKRGSEWKEILGEVMSYVPDGRDAERAVV
ncbi:hypothetical protein FRC04_002842 [Tulasnella sp. 424]|nr:hypothetical protein FRC04_002842 [Tulasnella sp. 424]